MNKHDSFKSSIDELIGRWRELPDSTPYYSLVYSQNFREYFDTILNYHKASSFLTLGSDFYWDIIPELDINAVAFKDGDSESLGLFFGLISLVYHFYGVLFCRKDFLPEIESANKFGDLKLYVNEISTDELEFQINQINKIKKNLTLKYQKIPNDIDRYEYMAECGLNTCLFVCFHEIGHIIRGHFDDETINNDCKRLFYEFDDKNSFDEIELKYFEIDADKFASYMFVKFILERFSEFGLELSVHCKKNWLSILLFFILLDLKRGKNNSKSHPNPAHRYVLVKKSILNLFKTKNHEQYEVVQKAINNIEITVKQFFDRYKFSNIRFYSDIEDDASISELESNYLEVSPSINVKYNSRNDAMNRINTASD